MSTALPPPGLRIATWNVNSVRLRMPQIERLVRHADPDILCLQELKCADAAFPHAAAEALGYPHRALAGMKGYNGVAILSRRPLSDITVHPRCGRDDARHVSARVAGVMAGAGGDGAPLEVHCVYVPAGGDLPDPDLNPKFAHKLAFLDDLAAWFMAWRGPRDALVLAGDLNVAPLPTDVWDHRKLSRVVTHTPVEIDRLGSLRRSLGWVDAARVFVPPDEPLFTWWSYRQGRDGTSWRAANRGRRLDHLWVSPALAPALAGVEVVSETRDWEPPSDHAPVVLSLAAPG